MTHTNNLTAQPLKPNSLVKTVLIGAGIGLVIISIFIFPVKHPQPEWGQYWMIRPLIITPLAGVAGAFWYYLLGGLRSQGGWKTIAAYVLGIGGFIIAIWMGIVLGLVGTLWH